MRVCTTLEAVVVGRSVEIDEMEHGGLDAILEHRVRQIPFAQDLLQEELDKRLYDKTKQDIDNSAASGTSVVWA